MDAPHKFQRRTVLIKRALQLKYIGMVFVSVLMASCIVGLDMYYTMARMLLKDNPGLAPAITQFNAIILLKLGLYLAIMLLLSLYVSHRFAGPIYRFEKSAQIASSGDLTHRVCLRAGDELLELQEEFNGMLASLQALVQKDRNLASLIGERLESLSRKLPDTPEASSLRDELQSLKLELAHLTQSFRRLGCVERACADKGSFFHLSESASPNHFLLAASWRYRNPWCWLPAASKFFSDSPIKERTRYSRNALRSRPSCSASMRSCASSGGKTERPLARWRTCAR